MKGRYRRYKHRRHLEDLQTAWEDVAPGLEVRWRSSFRHKMHPFWDEMLYEVESRSRRAAEAYETAKAVERGLPPENLTAAAIRETMETSALLASHANQLVGSSGGQDGYEVAELWRDGVCPFMGQLHAGDLPPGELAVLRSLGIKTSDEELEALFRRIRSRSRAWHDDRRQSADVHPGDVFGTAEQILRRESPSDEDDSMRRPKTEFFTGIRKVIFGSALVIGDVGLAFGFPPQLFVQPDHGWATMGSILGGVDIGLDGVESLWHGRRR